MFWLGQRMLHDHRARQIDEADYDEGVLPTKMLRHDAGDVSSEKAAQHAA